MAKRLLFDPTNPEHQRHYELAHVILMQGRVPLSEGENRRYGALQNEWEMVGDADMTEKVVDDRQFSVHRFTLPVGATEPVEIVLEDAKHELLLKLCEKTQLSGYIRRHQDALCAFVQGAENVKIERVPLIQRVR